MFKLRVLLSELYSILFGVTFSSKSDWILLTPCSGSLFEMSLDGQWSLRSYWLGLILLLFYVLSLEFK